MHEDSQGVCTAVLSCSGSSPGKRNSSYLARLWKQLAGSTGLHKGAAGRGGGHRQNRIFQIEVMPLEGEE